VPSAVAKDSPTRPPEAARGTALHELAVGAPLEARGTTAGEGFTSSNAGLSGTCACRTRVRVSLGPPVSVVNSAGAWAWRFDRIRPKSGDALRRRDALGTLPVPSGPPLTRKQTQVLVISGVSCALRT
jgi:hypothetical protein